MPEQGELSGRLAKKARRRAEDAHKIYEMNGPLTARAMGEAWPRSNNRPQPNVLGKLLSRRGWSQDKDLRWHPPSEV